MKNRSTIYSVLFSLIIMSFGFKRDVIPVDINVKQLSEKVIDSLKKNDVDTILEYYMGGISSNRSHSPVSYIFWRDSGDTYICKIDNKQGVSGKVWMGLNPFWYYFKHKDELTNEEIDEAYARMSHYNFDEISIHIGGSTQVFKISEYLINVNADKKLVQWIYEIKSELLEYELDDKFKPSK